MVSAMKSLLHEMLNKEYFKTIMTKLCNFIKVSIKFLKKSPVNIFIFISLAKLMKYPFVEMDNWIVSVKLTSHFKKLKVLSTVLSAPTIGIFSDGLYCL